MHIYTVAKHGFNYVLVTVESDIRSGLFRFDIIGLADKTIEESRSRVVSALRNSKSLKEFKFRQKILILLSPAHVKKEGTHFDLPIAVECLLRLGAIKGVQRKKYVTRENLKESPSHGTEEANKKENKSDEQWLFFGELNLQGKILGVHAISDLIYFAQKKFVKHIVLPKSNFEEVVTYISTDSHTSYYFVDSIDQVVELLNSTDKSEYAFTGKQFSERELDKESTANILSETCSTNELIFDSIEDNEYLKRLIVIALSGRHHLLITGAPGAGKSMAIRACEELVRILDIDTSFIEPHHTASYSEILGNSKNIGLIHRAHNGILFLDEISEFNRRTLESLRQPLENGYTEIFQTSHAEKSFILPSNFQLLATSNLCKCGNFGSTHRRCRCITSSIVQYQNRISAALEGRIDLLFTLSDSREGQDSSVLEAYEEKLTGESALRTIIKVRGKIKSILKEIESKHIQDTNLEYTSDKEVAENLRIKNIKKIRSAYTKWCIEQITKNKLSEVLQLIEEAKVSKREEESIIRVAQTITLIDDKEHITSKEINEAIRLRERFTLEH